MYKKIKHFIIIPILIISIAAFFIDPATTEIGLNMKFFIATIISIYLIFKFVLKRFIAPNNKY